MPQVKLSQQAVQDIERLYNFLKKASPNSAKLAISTIRQAFTPLKTMPFIGKELEENHELRELIIKFGNSGYVALYKYYDMSNEIVILAIRHQKEVGY